jgi:hypothetical protein
MNGMNVGGWSMRMDEHIFGQIIRLTAYKNNFLQCLNVSLKNTKFVGSM